MKLYEIHKSYSLALEAYYEAEGTEDEAVALANLSSIADARDVKLDSCCGWYKNLLAELQAVEDHIHYLNSRRAILAKKCDDFKRYISLNLTPGEPWTNGLHDLRWRKSTETVIHNEELLPKEFLKEKVTYSPSKTEIKKAIESGVEVPGAEVVYKNNLVVK